MNTVTDPDYSSRIEYLRRAANSAIDEKRYDYAENLLQEAEAIDLKAMKLLALAIKISAQSAANTRTQLDELKSLRKI